MYIINSWGAGDACHRHNYAGTQCAYPVARSSPRKFGIHVDNNTHADNIIIQFARIFVYVQEWTWRVEGVMTMLVAIIDIAVKPKAMAETYIYISKVTQPWLEGTI